MRATLRPAVRSGLAILAVLFVAGALVSLRLHLRVGEPLDAGLLRQGLEVMAAFAVALLPAALASRLALLRWPRLAGRRPVLGAMTYLLALAVAMAVYGAFVIADGLAQLYLVSGSVAHALAAWPPRRAPVAAKPVAA